MLIRRAGLVVLLMVLSACTTPTVEDDPVMEPPAGEVTTPPTAEEGSAGDSGEGSAPAGWSRGTDAPLALTEVAAAPFGGSVWAAGGFDEDGTPVATVLVYDPTFDAWEEGPALPEAVHHASLVSTGDALHLVGGYTDASFADLTDAVRTLDPASGEWTDGPPLPEPRAAGAAAWDGERVVYGGGVGPDGLAGDVWALAGGTWTPIGSLSEDREHLAAASDGDGRVWFLGGRTGGFDTNLAAVDLAEGDQVRRLGDLPTARGGLAGLHLPGAGACALGGEGPDGTFAEVECLDADGAVTELPPLAVARHGLGAVVVEGIAYAVLGGPEHGLFVSAAVEALPADQVPEP
jgi:non-specific serine/threonine protein kinase